MTMEQRVLLMAWGFDEAEEPPDPDLIADDWECLCDNLTEEIEKRNADGYWDVEVRNFGWQRLAGYSNFRALTGKEFLQQVLPKTECRFRIYAEGENGFAIQNYHHDSPVGNEWYFAQPTADED